MNLKGWMNMKSGKKGDENSNNHLAIGLSLGLLFGMLWGNLALGLVLGVVFGSLSDTRKKK